MNDDTRSLKDEAPRLYKLLTEFLIPDLTDIILTLAPLTLDPTSTPREIIDIDFYFEDSIEPFSAQEFQANSISRQNLEFVEQLIRCMVAVW